MASDFRDASPTELAAAYDKHAQALRTLARELHIPDAEAEELIEDALIAALVQKTSVDVEEWLAATLTAAANCRGESEE